MAAEWLNATLGTPSHQRAFGVLQELQKLETALDSIRNQKVVVKGKRLDSEPEIMAHHWALVKYSELGDQVRKRLIWLNDVLSKYVFVPAFSWDIRHADFLGFNTVPRKVRGKQILVSDGTVDVRVDEASVIAALARLAARRELYKLHRCKRCDRWHISERQIDKFCSQKCRQQSYKEEPGFKERNARNQENWRKNDRREAVRTLPIKAIRNRVG